MNTFAEKLSTLRKRAGFKQEDFASEVGVSVDTVRRWEGEKQEPRLGELWNIAKVLNADINELIGDDNGTIIDTKQEKSTKTRLPRSNKGRTIIIQQGNVRVEIPATSQGYAILKEKLKEVSMNPDITLTSEGE